MILTNPEDTKDYEMGREVFRNLKNIEKGVIIDLPNAYNNGTEEYKNALIGAIAFINFFGRKVKNYTGWKPPADFHGTSILY